MPTKFVNRTALNIVLLGDLFGKQTVLILEFRFRVFVN